MYIFLQPDPWCGRGRSVLGLESQTVSTKSTAAVFVVVGKNNMLRGFFEQGELNEDNTWNFFIFSQIPNFI